MVKKLFKRIENEFLTKNEGYEDIIKSNILPTAVIYLNATKIVLSKKDVINEI